MSDEFSNTALERVVAQICQTVGYTRTQITALEVLTSVLMEYIKTLCKGAHRYSELAGRSDPMLCDFHLVFKDLGINTEDIKEYIDKVGEIPPPLEVPKYPLKMENHLNFLRPGSNEVILRPLHVHEYLPPQFPEMENKPVITDTVESNIMDVSPSSSPSPTSSHKSLQSKSCRTPKKARCTIEGQPLREMKSILMTRSGFLSSSCEGKLPQVMLPKDGSVVNKEVHKSTTSSKITSMTLLAAKGLTKKSKKSKHRSSSEHYLPKLKKPDNTANLVVPPLRLEKKINRDEVIRKKVKRNLERLQSESQFIDRRLKTIVSLNNKHKYTKLGSSSKPMQTSSELASGSYSVSSFRVSDKHSKTNYCIRDNDSVNMNIEYRIDKKK